MNRREPKAWNERGPRSTSAQVWAESAGAVGPLFKADSTPVVTPTDARNEFGRASVVRRGAGAGTGGQDARSPAPVRTRSPWNAEGF